ncbi:AAA family ATPase [Brevibacillus laterosporus]|uniref:AAA family ATPase n=1 Tax=Brevibacillus laterosporus TaxID=1465 RepID=UPI0018CDAB5A|nr:chromosome partitioning protein ParA [Brevibacillus laterosporus]MBG9787021.1 chromosome partitioning protein ParA [Brevibacillus laterosporus]
MKKILLPKLIKVEVNNFSLYKQQPTFSFDFENGINAIIGVNGIGKTTFVELILYCLVGFKRKYKQNKRANKITFEKSNSDYFISRFNDEFDNENVYAILTYKIGREQISVCRSLLKDEVLYVVINGEKYDISEEEYDEIILEKLGFTEFKSLQTIVREFLVFDEQRLNVAWEMDNQDEILRILLLDEGLLVKFNELEKRIVYLDSTGRHLSEDRRIAKERIAVLVEEKRKLLENVTIEEETKDTQNEEKLNYSELLGMKTELDAEINAIKSELDQLINDSSQYTYEVNKYIGERNELNQELESLDNRISKEEAKLYSSIYDRLPDYYFTLEKTLINDGKCLACNNKENELKERFKKHKENHTCIVCSSLINVEEEVDPNIVIILNKFNNERQELQKRIENRQKNLDRNNKEYAIIDSKIQSLLKVKEQKSQKLIQVESLVSEHKKDVPKDTYSQLLLNLDNQINELTKQIDEVYGERDEAKAEMIRMQDQFVLQIKRINSELSSYFNKYASTFLGLECELTMKRSIIRFIPHIQFLPKVSGIERGNIYSVSESQRFFLDQAFRMAIIDFLQQKIENFETFFITETPEGSLDLVYEDQVANMFLLFAESSNNIIFTSNLNSSNFLYKIFSKFSTGDKSNRVLNMVEKGNMSALQKDYKKEFQERLAIITGGEGKNG